MHEVLSAAIAELGLAGELSDLQAAASRSAEFMSSAQAKLLSCAELAKGDGLAVADLVAFGSLARHEFTPESDLDFMVLAIGMPSDPRSLTELLTQGDSLRRSLAVTAGKDPGDPIRKPGASGIFGCIVSSLELTERIGLQDDSNHNQTRRLELLQESVSLMNYDVHERVTEHLLSRYLHPFLGEIEQNRVPRFLLNDVIRYWRTIAVDNQAKVWSSGSNEGWGLRYLKLILPRKLTFAGNLVSLLGCGVIHNATIEDLKTQFAMPPLARLAQLHCHLQPSGQEALRDVLIAADRFIRCSGSAEWRASVNLVKNRINEDPVNEDFRDARALARRMQDKLNVIFFEDPLLRQHSVQYLAM